MINFGQYAVIDKITHNFSKEPEWWWRFRPATVADEIELQRYIADGSARIPPITLLDVSIRELALVSDATNIPGAGLEESGSPNQFEELLKQMPIEMMDELYRAMIKLNPIWGPSRQKENEKDTNSQDERSEEQSS